MELQLKDIEPYLPYKLKFTGDIGFETTLCMIDFNKNQMKLCDKTGNAETASLLKNKPLLRPWSDLIKEIEHNGEMFTPMIRLACKHWLIINDISDITCAFKTRFECYYSGEILFSINQTQIGNLEYWLINQLLQWHFDVFGLIEEGLAKTK